MSEMLEGLGVVSTAVVMGEYRYLLTRRWDEGASVLTFVMLNPSIADASVDDPTIRRCVGFARRSCFGGIAVLNLYAYRATDPSELGRVADPVGPLNDQVLAELLPVASTVVAAWGANTHAADDRVRTVAAMRSKWLCLGTTLTGSPRHPLYVRGDQPLIPWEVPS